MISAIALGIGALVPAHGATESGGDSGLAATSAAVTETEVGEPATSGGSLTEQEVANLEILETHIDAAGQLDFEAAAGDPRLDEQFLLDFTEGYALVVNHGPTNTGVTGGAQSRSSAAATSSCAGVNGVAGQQVFLDSCNAGALSSSMAAGAGVATLTAIITAATGAGLIVAGSIAGGLALASSLTSLCNSWGRGIFINVGTPPFCWSQS